ncbi:diaminopimelate epimerase [Pseudomonas sp. dw_358]|uniref:diaminopimelate epimerase n=1 Tax=Pseudomonas sp. dw_358 TaxID=2720083 RepID=UPI001BD44454|nr:diaminopimelate epimerase [Pseudomonas sp. dw_358]
MTPLYDVRGNRYAVITPHALREQGIDLPAHAEQAAQTHKGWAYPAIAAHCTWPSNQRPEGAKPHRCDGLLVGPFQDAAPFDLLIVNTDGTLAERSGNGLTIFAQFLADTARVDAGSTFTLRVHHDKAHSPASVFLRPAPAGFWLDLGAPSFGPLAVDAGPARVSPAVFNGREVSRVAALVQVDSQWAQSVMVRIGNPHCVTLLGGTHELPIFAASLHQRLQAIAFAEDSAGSGDPCPAGINLQWARLTAPDEIEARVFERGEGPTASSGTSASAVACAAWAAGWIKAGLVKVKMPGGTAPVQLVEADGALQQVLLLGSAARVQ